MKIRSSIILLSASILLLLGVASCNKDNVSTVLPGAWTERSNFEGVVRSDAVAFAIGNKGYMGTGFDGSHRLNDFWQYDPDLNFWQQKADFACVARNQASGFGIGNKGYIGTGYDGTNFLNDFYEYNPANNLWTAKANFGGSSRYAAVGFSLLNNGYIATGFDGNTKKDVWKFDTTANTWTQVVSIGGEKRSAAVSFVIDNKAYICSGIDNGVYQSDVWQYDPSTGLWAAMASLVEDTTGDGSNDFDLQRSGAVGFSMKGKGYLSTGTYSGNLINTWVYNPSENKWHRRADCGGQSRTGGTGFSINDRGFVLTGKNGNTRYDDVWEFTEYAQ